MTSIRRLLYLGYYFRRMNWPMLRRFMRHTAERQGIGGLRQVASFTTDSLRYNISPLEWYQFGFWSLAPAEKATWAGTGTMYEFQLYANPPEQREVLNDKRRFYKAYGRFFRHELLDRKTLEQEPRRARELLGEHEKLVFKDATGNCGASVHIVPTRELAADSLVDWMRQNGYDMVETFARQHPTLQALSPSGVNTVRIFTLVTESGEYRVLGCRLRISVDSHVDNLAAGNLAAPIDAETGLVNGPGVYSDITRSPERIHPRTGVRIEGFQVPFWQETLNMVREASLLHPENRSIGWDVVVTPEGPGLIEGNHDWCKLVWQLPVRKGLKAMLEDGAARG